MFHGILSMFVIIFIASCSGGLPEEFPAPDFKTEDLFTGEEISLSDFKGKPVMLYFFASW